MDPNFPDLLLQLINNKEAMRSEKNRAINLLDEWVKDFYEMTMVERNRYSRVLFSPKFLNRALNAHIEGYKVSKIITMMYGMLLEKWGDLTKYLRT